MIKVLLLLCLALGIQRTHRILPWVLGYIAILTLYILKTTGSSIELTLGVIAFHAALAILYAWMLKKILLYFHLEGALFWWIALLAGLLIGVI
jgi:hypothetical protein